MIRPKWLSYLFAAEGEHGLDPGFVFLHSRVLGPIRDVNKRVMRVTKALCGRPIAPHRFRHSVVQAFYNDHASPTEMRGLATLMQHSEEVQMKHYAQPQFERESSEFASRLVSMFTAALRQEAAGALITNGQSQAVQAKVAHVDESHKAPDEDPAPVERRSVKRSHAAVGVARRWTPIEEECLRTGIVKHLTESGTISWVAIRGFGTRTRSLDMEATERQGLARRNSSRSAKMTDLSPVCVCGCRREKCRRGSALTLPWWRGRTLTMVKRWTRPSEYFHSACGACEVGHEVGPRRLRAP